MYINRDVAINFQSGEQCLTGFQKHFTVVIPAGCSHVPRRKKMNFKKVSMINLILICSLAIAASSLSTADTITLKLSSFVPEPHFMNRAVLQPWIEMVEERTDGIVQIEVYYGASLGKPQDQYDMAVKGIADITWGILGYTPGRFPLSTVMDIPFMSPSAEVGSRMIQRLYDEGYLSEEYKDVKLLALGMPNGVDLHSRKKLVKNLEDLKGLRVRVWSPIMGEVFKTWGAVPVSMPATEVYVSMERGVIDAVVMDPITLFATKLNEVVEYHTRAGMFSSAFFFAMNKDTWGKLGPDIQKVIDELSGEYFAVELNGKRADVAAAEAWKRIEAEGQTVYLLDKGEKARWEESSRYVAEKWVDEMEKKGLSGEKVYNEALRLKKEFQTTR
jgi:TRAP-type C4-dicarboxylate transport system substrate-binding protein